jgi:hypothetical protein
MADFGAPVAAGVQTPNALGTLSDLLSLKGKAQQIQTGQYLQQSAQAEAAVKSQTAKENQGLAQILQDPVGNGIVDAQGNPTPTAQAAIMKVAPTTGADVYDKVVKAANSKVLFNTSVNNLNASERAEVGSTLSGAAAGAQSPADIQSAADALLKSKEGTPVYGDYKRILDTSMQIVNHANDVQRGSGRIIQPGQEAYRQAALGTGRQVLGAAGVVGAGGIGAPSTGQIDSGAILTQGTVAPALQGGGFTPSTQVVRQAPPTVATLPSGSIGIVGGVGGVPAGAANATSAPQSKLQPIERPAPNAPKADQDNYNNQIAASGQLYNNVKTAANDPMNGVQATRFRNQSILDLIPHANTGPGLKLFNTLASRLPGATGDAYQDVEHYLAQNSAAMAKTMGVPSTNLGAETAAAAAGSVERNPGALKEITKTNDALNTAMDLYSRGLAKVTNNGSDMSRVNSFQQAFGSNMDVNAIRWADANRRGDKEEISALRAKGSQQVQQWVQKLKTLKSLSDSGDLP